MEIDTLEKIGLKEKEAKIYISLLKQGSCLANQLAKKTNILRSSIYDYLDVLLDKGFITYTIKSGKKYFQAVDPQKILENFKEEKTKQEKNLQSIIPSLIKLKNSEEKKISVKVFEGKEGMKSALSSILREKPKEIIAHGSSGASYKVIPFFMEHWHKERVKKKIRMKMIFNDTPETQRRLKEGPKLNLVEMKLMKLPGVLFTGTLMYNKKVMISVWDPESLLAILIENDEINKTYTNEFNLLWKQAKP